MSKDLMYRSPESNGQTVNNRLAKSPPEEPDASIAHVRVCEGPGRRRPGLLDKVLLLAIGLLAVCGCASIRQPTPFGDATARTFCKDVELPKMQMSNSVSNAVSNQTLSVEGYKSGVNVKAIEAIGAACGIAVGNALRAAGMMP